MSAVGDELRRRRYDMHGKAVVQEAAGAMDPAAMFAMLFGTDAFEDYVGQLAMATLATLDQASRPEMLAQLQSLQAVRPTRCPAPDLPGCMPRSSRHPPTSLGRMRHLHRGRTVDCSCVASDCSCCKSFAETFDLPGITPQAMLRACLPACVC